MTHYQNPEVEAPNVGLDHIRKVFDHLVVIPSRASITAILRITHEQVRRRTRAAGAIPCGLAFLAISPLEFVYDHTKWHGVMLICLGAFCIGFGLIRRKEDRFRNVEVLEIKVSAMDALEQLMANATEPIQDLDHRDHLRLRQLLLDTKRRPERLVALVNGPERVFVFPDI